jgi:hypothetical protein
MKLNMQVVAFTASIIPHSNFNNVETQGPALQAKTACVGVINGHALRSVP